ncbi:helix-turn-helix domain-containing protein [Nocardia sp. NPDC002869]|uniref:helix-turn-helix domain-containing protein n=1 Tax=Nocardia sp. NPDC002869 TaxID=3161032 RepID=UPI00398C8875
MSEPIRGRRTESARELAARLGVSPRTIQRTAAEAGEDFEARANDRRERIIELALAGMTYAEIAAELRIAPALVATRVVEARAAGIDIPPRRRGRRPKKTSG